MIPSDKKTEPLQARTDWATLRSMSEDGIERIAAEDEDNPATLSDDEWGHATWTRDTLGLTADKTSINASFDRDVVDFFERDGQGYQTRMNAVLRRHMEVQQGKKAGS